MNAFKEVERVCRDSTVYDPIEVKDFLKEKKLADPRPLMCVHEQRSPALQAHTCQPLTLAVRV